MISLLKKISGYGNFLCLLVLLASGSLFGSENIEKIYLPLTCDVWGKGSEEDEEPGKDGLPRNFRTTQDEIKEEADSLGIRLDGLRELLISGTSQFTEEQLQAILTKLQKKVLVVDLREETHLILEEQSGNQLPITAYASQNLGNYGKTLQQIEKDLDAYKYYLLAKSSVVIFETLDSEVQLSKGKTVTVANVFTEQELVDKANATSPFGVEYHRLPVTDHLKLTPEAVDAFLELLKKIASEPDLQVLFHCQAGRGRTGLIMVMTDMVENAKKYDLKFLEILKRQELLGSPDFTNIKPHRAEESLGRFNFLKHFFEFTIAEDGLDTGVSYSFWLQVHPEPEEEEPENYQN